MKLISIEGKEIKNAPHNTHYDDGEECIDIKTDIHWHDKDFKEIDLNK